MIPEIRSISCVTVTAKIYPNRRRCEIVKNRIMANGSLKF